MNFNHQQDITRKIKMELRQIVNWVSLRRSFFINEYPAFIWRLTIEKSKSKQN